MSDITPYVKVRIKHLKLSPGMYRNTRAVLSGKFTFEELLDTENKNCRDRRHAASMRHQEKYCGNTMKKLRRLHRKMNQGMSLRAFLRSPLQHDVVNMQKLTPKMERILAA